MLPDFVRETLKGMGEAGAAITLLLMTIMALTTAVVAQWRQSNKVMKYRLAERDTLNKALIESTTALIASDRVAHQIAEANADLEAAINKLTATFERSIDRVQSDTVTQNMVISSLAEAVRTHTTTVNQIWARAPTRRS
jgi:hypothetical protein